MAELLTYGTPESMMLEPDRQAVRHHVGYGQQTVVCRVSREGLEDLARDRDVSQSDLLKIAQEHFDQLTDAWGQRISLGQFEDDGSVLLRTRDLT